MGSVKEIRLLIGFRMCLNFWKLIVKKLLILLKIRLDNDVLCRLFGAVFVTCFLRHVTFFVVCCLCVCILFDLFYYVFVLC